MKRKNKNENLLKATLWINKVKKFGYYAKDQDPKFSIIEGINLLMNLLNEENSDKRKFIINEDLIVHLIDIFHVKTSKERDFYCVTLGHEQDKLSDGVPIDYETFNPIDGNYRGIYRREDITPYPISIPYYALMIPEEDIFIPIKINTSSSSKDIISALANYILKKTDLTGFMKVKEINQNPLPFEDYFIETDFKEIVYEPTRGKPTIEVLPFRETEHEQMKIASKKFAEGKKITSIKENFSPKEELLEVPDNSLIDEWDEEKAEESRSLLTRKVNKTKQIIKRVTESTYFRMEDLTIANQEDLDLLYKSMENTEGASYTFIFEDGESVKIIDKPKTLILKHKLEASWVPNDIPSFLTRDFFKFLIKFMDRGIERIIEKTKSENKVSDDK